MSSVPTIPRRAVAAAIELERGRLQSAFAPVYREDGSIDEVALWRFAAMLYGQQMEER